MVTTMKKRVERIGARIERAMDMVPNVLSGICAFVLFGSSLFLLFSCVPELAPWGPIDDHQRITVVALATLFGFVGLAIFLGLSLKQPIPGNARSRGVWRRTYSLIS